MNGYLLDTHIWVWELIGSDQQPGSVKRILQHCSDSLWLSPISVWEAGNMVRTGKLELKCEFSSWVEQALEQMPLKEAPLDYNVVLKTFGLALEHEDPADHFLVATALEYDLTLVTVDERLIGRDKLVTFPV